MPLSNPPTQADVLSHTTELTNAQIKALPGGVGGEGITSLLAAPGTGQAYRIIGLQLVSSFSVAYGNISSNAQFIGAVGSGGDISGYQYQTLSIRNVSGVNEALTTLLTSTTPQTAYLCARFSVEDIGGSNFIGHVTTQPLSVIDNGAIALVCFNEDGNFNGGHEDNTLRVTVLYTVVDL